MDYLSILPNEICSEIYSHLTPQEILHSCCLNKVLVKVLTEEFWCQYVTRIYSPQDFGIDNFNSNVLAYLNIPSWIELVKLLFVIIRTPGIVAAVDIHSWQSVY
jgi:hypothetical protein